MKGCLGFLKILVLKEIMAELQVILERAPILESDKREGPDV